MAAGRECRIVAESYEAGVTVSAVGRRYALSPQQLFAWRRAARQPVAAPSTTGPLFVPAVVTVDPEAASLLAHRISLHLAATGVSGSLSLLGPAAHVLAE